MLREKCGSIGKAIPNVDLLVADENGNRLPPNHTGHIVARGANIMAGYWKDTAGTNEVLKNIAETVSGNAKGREMTKTRGSSPDLAGY